MINGWIYKKALFYLAAILVRQADERLYFATLCGLTRGKHGLIGISSTEHVIGLETYITQPGIFSQIQHQ